MMADDIPAAFTLKRWSRRKLEAARTAPAPATLPAAMSFVPAVEGSSPAAHDPPSALPAASSELPPIASLSFESDFSAFLRPKVEAALTRQALKKLFSDPRFNVMDGLDTYIDDYSKADPISAEVVREMMQSRYIFNPPQTRVNAEGFVEDVPAEETMAAAEPAAAAGASPESAPSTVAPADAFETPAINPTSTVPSDPPTPTHIPSSETKASGDGCPHSDPNQASPR